MSTTGKNPAQSYSEMTESMTASKEKGLVTNRTRSSVYKVESGEYQENKLRELIAATTPKLVEAATKEKVSLEDIETVKERTIMYLRACEETGTFPSSIGLARSLGYSDRALRNWRNYKSDTETAQWLEMFNETCADILNQSALKNNANSIFAMFIDKALYGFVEKNELVLTPNKPGYEEGVAYSAEDIRKRYMADVPAED